ncbi:hypothetical protein CHS0354_038633 [Potamilus streckersoni]|uniref:Uncharacterized protein n=1 Tax=Potamilus streckersoni TaxID=2493646 RepID=A0AAE0WCX7_9BIVA|nr:hypothetical protein CHS0354_038633 [Potamilus streckersoni]
MVGMSIVIIWLSIDFIMRKAKGIENEVVAISGCNATLEWKIGTTYLDAVAHSINVINANGHKVAEKKAMKCKYEIDSSMYCEVRNTSIKEWRFVMAFFNVTQASTGKYTGQLKYGPRNEINVTTELTVIATSSQTSINKLMYQSNFVRNSTHEAESHVY